MELKPQSRLQGPVLLRVWLYWAKLVFVEANKVAQVFLEDCSCVWRRCVEISVAAAARGQTCRDRTVCAVIRLFNAVLDNFPLTILSLVSDCGLRYNRKAHIEVRKSFKFIPLKAEVIEFLEMLNEVPMATRGQKYKSL